MPPSSQDIQGLIAAAHDLISVQADTNERLVRVELTNQQLQKAMTNLTDSQTELNKSMSKMVVTTTKMESELLNLDKKMFTQIEDLKTRYDKLEDKVDNQAGRIYLIEMENTSTVATRNAEEKVRGWFATNWFNLFNFFVKLCFAVGAVIYIYQKVK